MEEISWLSIGTKILEFGKEVGSKVVEGAQFVAEKSKPAVDKIKEGASFVAEKAKPMTDKIVEGANYLAEKAKPATDKIKEGASIVGDKVKGVYNDVKSQITGEPQQQPQSNGLNQNQGEEMGNINSEHVAENPNQMDNPFPQNNNFN